MGLRAPPITLLFTGKGITPIGLALIYKSKATRTGARAMVTKKHNY